MGKRKAPNRRFR